MVRNVGNTLEMTTKRTKTNPEHIMPTCDDRNQDAEHGLKNENAGNVEVEPCFHTRKLERCRELVQRELRGRTCINHNGNYPISCTETGSPE